MPDYSLIIPAHQHMRHGYRYTHKGPFRAYILGNEQSRRRAIERCLKDGEAFERLAAKPQKYIPLRVFFNK